MATDRTQRPTVAEPVGTGAAEATQTCSPSVAPGGRGGGEVEAAPASRPRGDERYEILREHARGGLGRVSRARDHELGRDIAIKELISRGHVSEIRFLREAMITARLEHPGIVPVYEAGRWADGTPFYAMKLVAGRPLRELIAERTTVDARIALLHHVIAVADAMAYAHGRHVIHRDLKPANVIVGEFGETIVIDWGLAKDLSAGEDASLESGSSGSASDDGLTTTGSVLGTPAYMPPEQQRGEPVDQRADVYAIGAMLWELCTGQKSPPPIARQRRHLLRRAGIDRDLVSIIDKAVDPEPARRYRDAGALAADLKAFKAGARIAARDYSAAARVAHWTRRHRGQAVSAAAAIALAAAGIALYLGHVATERDRATAASNALILEHAQLLLHTDPTAAFELAERYTGDETTRQAMLRAEALGRGVARYHVAPHSHAILAARPLADGSVLTISIDGALAKTSPDGAIRVVARGAERPYHLDHAAARHRIAYPCLATAICIMDVRSELQLPPPADPPARPIAGLAWSPGGELLAALSLDGELALWRVGDGRPEPRGRARLDRGDWIGFVDDRTLVAQSASRVQLFHLHPAAGLGAPVGFDVAGAGWLVPDAASHLVAISTVAGDLVLIDTAGDRIARRATLCKGALHAVSVIAARSALGYACQSGEAGLWDLGHGSATALLHIAGGAAIVAGSPDGRYLVAGGSNGEIAIHDFVSGLQSHYLGHASRISALSPPAPGSPYLVTADVGGELRRWPAPDAPVRAIAMDGSLFRAAPLAGDDVVVATGDTPTIQSIVGGSLREVSGHDPVHLRFATAPARPQLVAFGTDDELELWSFDAAPTRRSLHTRHGAVNDVWYSPDGKRLLVGSQDGTVTTWSTDGEPGRTLAAIGEPVWFLRILWRSGGFLAGGFSGTLWTFDDAGLRFLGHEPGLINSIITSPDARWAVTASSEGILRWYDLATRRVSTFRSPHPSNEYLLFSPDSTTLVASSDKAISRYDTPRDAAAPPWTWRQADAFAGHFVFSSDSQWFAAVGEQGGIWFNRRGERRWIYLATGSARVSRGVFSADNRRFIATEPSGRVLIVDMHAPAFR